MAGQGLLYLKVKQGFECIYNGDTENEDDMAKSVFETTDKNEEQEVKQGSEFIYIKGDTEDDEGSHIPPICDTHDASDANSVYDALVSEMNEKELSDPIEILRFLQQSLIRGRALDVIDVSSASEGVTNYICVDRQNILATTFAELESIDDFCKTFEVDFMGELAKDLGGPRREWIRLMNFAMREKYFAKGLREFLAPDYYYVGVMIGVALLQNGQLPTFLPLDVIDKVVITPNEDKCIANLQRGLNKFGLTRIFQRKPILLHLLRPNNISLSAKMLLNILNPVFAPEGSTAHSKEKEIYAVFVKYVRQVASGRRPPLNLSSILVFVTGSAEDPVLGFAIQPTITFVCGQSVYQGTEPEESTDVCYIPTAHTCTNNMSIPRGPLLAKLPTEERLFEMFDLAFSNNHFGVM